jgi:hypothetical protein
MGSAESIGVRRTCLNHALDGQMRLFLDKQMAEEFVEASIEKSDTVDGISRKVLVDKLQRLPIEKMNSI